LGDVASNSVVYKGLKYMTLDAVNPNDNSTGCQTTPIQLPAGFQLATNTLDSRQVIALYRWGTSCVNLADGTSWGTAQYYPGTDCWYNNEIPLIEYNLDGYVTRGCSRRILIVEKTSPLPACSLEFCQTRTAANCQAPNKEKCTCQKTGRKKVGMATVLDPNAVGYHNRVYKTIDNVDPNSATNGCQTGALAVPKGWKIASTWVDWESRSAAGLWNWATECLVVIDGPNGFKAWGTKLGKPKVECSETGIVSQDKKSQAVTVLKCNRRVFLMKDDYGFKCLPA